ncbi:MAG: hypothetical protein WBA07_25455 [Rivularia sp. (in: cyanobacteria)]
MNSSRVISELSEYQKPGLLLVKLRDNDVFTMLETGFLCAQRQWCKM